ncbi:MAG: exodeoxyribonuclease I, partial [Porticoccus sp.]
VKNFPETLNDEEQHRWEELRFNRLTNSAEGYLTLDTYFSEIDQLLGQESMSEKNRNILRALQDWGSQIL